MNLNIWHAWAIAFMGVCMVSLLANNVIAGLCAGVFALAFWLRSDD